VWTAKRADDAQAKLQSRLSRTGLVKGLSGGYFNRAQRKYAIDQQRGRKSRFSTRVGKTLGNIVGRVDAEGMRRQLEVHGVQMRAIAPAWKQRGAKKEEQRLGEATSVGQDIMNRWFGGYIIGKPEKTDYTTLARAARSRKAQSEIEAGGEEQEILTWRLENEFTNKDGTVRDDKIAEAEATLRTLLNNHDVNEWLKRPFFAEIMKHYGKGAGKVTQADLVLMLKHMFGDNQDTIRIAQNLEEAGLVKNDAWVKGITEWDDKNKKMAWNHTQDPGVDWKKDKSALISALYNAKKSGRAYIGAQRRQNLFTERADDKGNLMFRELHNVGKHNLVVGADSYLETKLEHWQPEFKQAMQSNLDLIVEWWMDSAKTGELSETEREKVHKIIAKVAGGAVGYGEQDMEKKIDALDDTKLLPEQRAKAKIDLDTIIVDAIESKQDMKYWEDISKINKNRTRRGYDVGDTYKATFDEATYQEAVKRGSAKGVNTKLDPLRHGPSAGGTGGAGGSGGGTSGSGGGTPGSSAPAGGSTSAPDREKVMATAQAVAQNIEQASPADFGAVPPGHFKPVSESIASALRDINQFGGMNQAEFATMLNDSIKKLNETIGHLPDELRKGLTESMDQMNTVGQAGGFKTMEEQLKAYYVLKGIQANLEKQRQSQEKKDQGRV
jgi:hypothetical protein